MRSEVSGWTAMNFYTWDSNNNTQQNGNWPGQRITATKEVDGQTWYYATYDIPTSKYYVNFVFSTGTGSPQSVDVTGVAEDRFFVVTAQQSGGKYVVEDVSQQSGISLPTAESSTSSAIYDLSGRRLAAPLQRGVYVQDGVKRVVR